MVEKNLGKKKLQLLLSFCMLKKKKHILLVSKRNSNREE